MTTDDIGPYSNYRLTVRLALLNKPGIFAKVAGLLAEEGLGEVAALLLFLLLVVTGERRGGECNENGCRYECK